MKNFPKALIVLKAGAGANWRAIKKQFLEFLLDKKRLEESDIDSKLKSYLLKLIFDSYYADIRFSNYKQCSLTKEKLISYTHNVFKTLHKLSYDSELVCYIGDSYNTKKSGNKKYPNLI